MNKIILTIIPYLKVVFILIGAVFGIAIIILIPKASWFKRRFLESWTEFFIYRPFGVKKTFKQWAKISKKLETGKTNDYKMALIEADGLLVEIFKKMGYKGETMKEILEQIDSKILPNIEEIRQVHKIRNNVVHDPDYDLSLEQARKLIAAYEKAFRDLEMF